ncbi:ExbD/TolR family protein [Candidatus Latescibacterota bacterium]
MKSRFKTRRFAESSIPTGTMADISLLLILFFMVSSVFVIHRGFAVSLPRAERIDPIMNRRNIVNVWIGSDGRIMVDEYDTELSNIGTIVQQKLVENPRFVVLIKSDKNTRYRMISEVIEQLKEVNALRISFIAENEQE